MGLLKDETFICLDCETTGLDVDNDRIIEVAVVSFKFSEILDQFESLINPEKAISEASLEIHHINQDMLKDKPKIEEHLPHILKIIGKKIIVGHGIQFDVQLLINAARRANIPCQLQTNRQIDTLRLARLYGDSPRNSLSELSIHFNVSNDGAHRAMQDVTTNIEVFKHLTRKFSKTEDIFDQLAKPIRMKTMPLGKHKGRLFGDIPLHYLLKAATMDYDQDLLYTIRLELKKRKQGGLFSQAANPFSEL